MISDAKQITEIWRVELEKASKEILTASMIGKKLEKVEVEVNIEIPLVMYEAIANACKKMGLPTEDINGVFANMASQGFERMVQERLGGAFTQNQSQQQPAANPALGIDDIKSQLGQLAELMNQVEAMKGMMGGIPSVAPINNPLTTNCPEPNVSTGPMGSSKSK